jgi:hypothetical protein
MVKPPPFLRSRASAALQREVFDELGDLLDMLDADFTPKLRPRTLSMDRATLRRLPSWRLLRECIECSPRFLTDDEMRSLLADLLGDADGRVAETCALARRVFMQAQNECWARARASPRAAS